jgi:putative oxidoreductase
MNDFGLLVSRLALGAGIAAHGAQKAFGAFDGPGPAGAAQFLQSIGFSPGERYAAAASWTELTSGALIALGLGGPIGPAALISTMVVAQSSVHAKNGFFAQKGGIELGVVYAAGALALASGGFGRLSLDRAFAWEKLRESWFTGLVVAGGVAAGLVVLAQRAEPQPAPDAQAASQAPAETGAPPPAETRARAASDAEQHELAATQELLAAASEGRAVPADLMPTADADAAAQA